MHYTIASIQDFIQCTLLPAMSKPFPEKGSWSGVQAVATKSAAVRLMGTRFEARNCISEPGSPKPYSKIFVN
jgi:hypothetical protein